MELNDLTGHECTYVIQNTTRDQDDQYLFKWLSNRMLADEKKNIWYDIQISNYEESTL